MAPDEMLGEEDYDYDHDFDYGEGDELGKTLPPNK